MLGRLWPAVPQRIDSPQSPGRAQVAAAADAPSKILRRGRHGCGDGRRRGRRRLDARRFARTSILCTACACKPTILKFEATRQILACVL